jgi:hypothetical protein
MRANYAIDHSAVLGPLRKEKPMEAGRSPPGEKVRSIGKYILRQQNGTRRTIQSVIKAFQKFRREQRAWTKRCRLV